MQGPKTKQVKVHPQVLPLKPWLSHCRLFADSHSLWHKVAIKPLNTLCYGFVILPSLASTDGSHLRVVALTSTPHHQNALSPSGGSPWTSQSQSAWLGFSSSKGQPDPSEVAPRNLEPKASRSSVWKGKRSSWAVWCRFWAFGVSLVDLL